MGMSVWRIRENAGGDGSRDIGLGEGTFSFLLCTVYV